MCVVIKAFVCLSSLLTSGHLQDGFRRDEDARRRVHAREAHRQDLQADGHKSRRWVAAVALLRSQATWCEKWQSAVRSRPAAFTHRRNSARQGLPGLTATEPHRRHSSIKHELYCGRNQQVQICIHLSLTHWNLVGNILLLKIFMNVQKKMTPLAHLFIYMPSKDLLTFSNVFFPVKWDEIEIRKALLDLPHVLEEETNAANAPPPDRGCSHWPGRGAVTSLGQKRLHFLSIVCFNLTLSEQWSGQRKCGLNNSEHSEGNLASCFTFDLLAWTYDEVI